MRWGRSRWLPTTTMLSIGALSLGLSVSLWPASVEPASAKTQPAQLPQPRSATNTVPAAAPPEPRRDASSGAESRDPVLLPITSARLEDRHIEEKPTPVALRIDALEVAAPIAPAGALPNGEMEVPDTVSEVAWFEYGPAPGQQGSAVLAAHVDLAGQGPGVFFGLRSLERGATVTVEFADGAIQHFVVVDGATYHKDAFDSERIFARSGTPMLTLITCGGGFNPSLSRYDSNVVVYAAPLADAAGTSR